MIPGKHAHPDLLTRTILMAELPVLTGHTHTHIYIYIYNIYITEDLRRRKQGARTLAAAFSDHLAVIIRKTFDTQRITRRNRT
jgi:hypothetical protein